MPTNYGFQKVIPFIKSSNLAETIKFYRDSLHFKLDMVWPQEENEATNFAKAGFASFSDTEGGGITVFAMLSAPASMLVIHMSYSGLQAYFDRLSEEGNLPPLTAESAGPGLGKIEL